MTADVDRLTPRTLIRWVRLVPVGGRQAPEGLVDLRIAGGRVTEVGVGLVPDAGEAVHDADGRWAIPGLWDKHVHLAQWAAARGRLDTSGTSSPTDVLRRLGNHIASAAPGQVVVGAGHRSATWTDQPTVAALDVVAGDRPVVLISGDGHHGWLSSVALSLVGAEPTDSPLRETDWYAAYDRLAELAPAVAGSSTEAYAAAVRAANAAGVVGVVDLEFGSDFRRWPDRWAAGIDTLRVRAGVYEEGMDEVEARGWSTGSPLVDGQDLVRLGPFKVISDGSLNTLSAWCREPYLGVEGRDVVRGQPNYDIELLVPMLARARGQGLEVAVHAIGDEALSNAVDAFEVTGARGGIEHVQLARVDDLARMARLGLVASVQPAHLLDDRDVTERYWPDRSGRVYAFRSMLDAGVTLALGSDAPVSPLDPWLAMAAAVHRTADERGPWHGEQALTVAEALAASTDGQPTLGPGSRGDVVLLDADPLAEQESSAAAAAHLRGIRVEATFVAGRAVSQAPTGD